MQNICMQPLRIERSDEDPFDWEQRALVGPYFGREELRGDLLAEQTDALRGQILQKLQCGDTLTPEEVTYVQERLHA